MTVSLALRTAALAGAAAAALAAACESGRERKPAVETARVAQVPVGPLPGLVEANLEAAVNPFAQDADALREGQRYFHYYNCGGCHGEHGGGGMGPSLRDAVWLYGSSDAQIANSIAEGRANGMPAWGRMLTPTQIWQITAYIKSMRTDYEPP